LNTRKAFPSCRARTRPNSSPFLDRINRINRINSPKQSRPCALTNAGHIFRRSSVFFPVNPVNPVNPVQRRTSHTPAVCLRRDRSIAAIFANADTQPREFTFTFDADRLGLGKAARWSIDRITTHGVEPLPRQSGRRFMLTVEVPARDGVALRLGGVNAGAIENSP
jgi:hypothetical protein